MIADVKRVGAEIAAAEPWVDVLINNAGSMFGTRKVTAEGLERTFALNHMSYCSGMLGDGMRRPGLIFLFSASAVGYTRADDDVRRHSLV